MMRGVFLQKIVSLDEFLNHPGQVQSIAHGQPVVIVNQNQPLLYLLTPDDLTAMIAQPDESKAIKIQEVRRTIADYTQELIHNAESRHKRNILSKKSMEILHYRIKRHILPFFKEATITEINTKLLSAFVDYLSAENIGNVAIAQYLIIVKMALQASQQQGHLEALPEFPSITAKRQSRGAFTLQEYALLLRTAWRMRNQTFSFQNVLHLNAMGLDKRLLTMRPEMYYLISFMVNSFVRPSDIKVMKNMHIKRIERAQTYLRLSLPETKGHDAPIVTMRQAVNVYEKLVRDAKQRGYGKPDDYVFLPEIKNREYAMRILGFLFNWLLFETNLKQGPHGIGRTLYSLRHTAITFRLLYGQGIDMLTLARNARTSVSMIEKHYASTLSGEMNISLLQSKRGLKPIKVTVKA